MTPNLSKAIEKATQLSLAVQEELAMQWLDELENEYQWQITLEEP